MGSSTVVHEVTAVALTSDGTVEAEMKVQAAYSPTQNPYGVYLTFNVGTSGAVPWEISRDLLIAGLNESTGEGDVRVRPRGLAYEIDLMPGPSGRTVQISYTEMQGFLLQCQEVVPQGHESMFVNLDAELDRFLH